ncbi:hypothetical protein CROQUDRAFT_82189 [Cronartium quercuum f. sp. fusiforme G11]|uniref:Uncharacterized protein n=1 Tax=Cronartium quercuum f. sp. fusiforme G11 TaxID=708437 RepID=A0A9P6NDY8_9BASI|nr:hypothetical protein CROQUDRAFT_82189 [Cronartium quercuum f. sp. fusiforme G11]
MSVRSASHAGSWYTSSPTKLKNELDTWLQAAHPDTEATKAEQDWHAVSVPVPIEKCRAVIAPHAGYAYSGPTAAWAYKTVDPTRIKRVFILGPSHHVYLERCALSCCTTYATPLGDLPIDAQINAQLTKSGLFGTMDIETDEAEHSIELHLPYIRHTFKDKPINIVPILVGSITSEQELLYGNALRPYLLSPENFFVVSSDFCHWGTRFSYTYYRDPANDEEPARQLSARAAAPTTPIHRSIEALDREALQILESRSHSDFCRYLSKTKNTICGRHPIGILLGALQGCDGSPELRFTRYAQSSQCSTIRDSSVSYASAFVSVDLQ